MSATLRRIEEHHNTREQVAGYLQTALELVDELQPPDDLRAAVFTEAARLIAGKQIVLEQAAPVLLDQLKGRPH